MTLEDFAKLAGVEVISCGPEWGGRFAYRMKDHPNSTYCGYRTINAAYKAWLVDSFGGSLSKTVLRLLKENK